MVLFSLVVIEVHNYTVHNYNIMALLNFIVLFFVAIATSRCDSRDGERRFDSCHAGAHRDLR